MSANETTTPTPRIQISAATSPNPPWTNVVFDCVQCGARYQLGCADECERAPHRRYRVPPCWTCGHVNEIKL